MKQETKPQDTSTRKDEYISKDLWRDDDGFIAQGSGDNYITFADTNVNDDDIDDRERRTDEIIEAYNGTIAKGYNPAAMEELYKALKNMYALTEEMGMIMTSDQWTEKFRSKFNPIMTDTETALQNAKI